MYQSNPRWSFAARSENYQGHPQFQARYFENDSIPRTPKKTNRLLWLAVAAIVVVMLLVIAGIVVALLVTRANNKQGDATTSVPLTSAASNFSSGPMPSALQSPAFGSVSLTGNFTIQNKQLSEVDGSLLCPKIVQGLSDLGVSADNCTIIDVRPGVQVRFSIGIWKAEYETDDDAKRRGIDALIRLLTNETSFGFQVNRSSIFFQDASQNNPAIMSTIRPLENSSNASQNNAATMTTTSYLENSQSVCSDVTWVSVPGSLGSSYNYLSGIGSPDACREACLALLAGGYSCYGVSWYSGSVYGCYVLTSSYLNYGYGSYYTSYILLRNQSNCDANNSCVYRWRGLARSQAFGGTRNLTIYTLNICIASCRNNPECSAIDWDYGAAYCWLFINTTDSDLTRYHPYIYHFDKQCIDPHATTLAQSSLSMLSQPSTTPALCPSWAVKFCEPTQQCIFSYQICDKNQDCPNDIDETNCTCDRYHYQCKNGRCIYQSWLCDGVKDCPYGDDESPPQCSTCNSTQFLCNKPHICISLSQQCDGIVNCWDSSDEAKCLKLSGNDSSTSNHTRLVSATYGGVPGYLLCADGWNEALSDALCQNMGYRRALSTYYELVNESAKYLALNQNVSSSNILALLQKSSCNSQFAVSLACSDSDCGTRTAPPNSIGPYIINGQQAKRGAWPWQVLYEIGIYSGSYFSWSSYCGGVLLNERWILTAGHCTIVSVSGLGYYGLVKPENVRISLGSISRLGDNDTEYAKVDQVYMHPLYSSSPVTDNDVGLLRLSEPVNFTDTIRPICLPSSTEDLSRFRVCVDTGFGRNIHDDTSDYLLQARMNIIPYRDCYYYNGYLLRGQTQICIGTLPTEGDINICSGDSGGPFACQDQNGFWKVIGINSYVIRSLSTGETCSRSVVARVTAYVDWIQQTMAANSV